MPEDLASPPLNDPAGLFYRQPLNYALHRYKYFTCFLCKEPYFGGLRDCQQAAAEVERVVKPEDLVCGSCSSIGVESCKIHGKDFLLSPCSLSLSL